MSLLDRFEDVFNSIYAQHVMLKKRSTDFTPKKHCLRRLMECLFLSKAGPKSGCLSYLIAIMRK